MATGRPKLLLADDSVTIQKVVTLTFADEGVEVVAVSDGEQAIKQLEENALPDVVLADVFMPGLNGYEVCRRIKADRRFRHIPVMLLVGSFEPFNEAEARRVGADDVLTKPFQSIRGLVSKVGSLLGGSEAKQEESHEQTETEQREPNKKTPETRAPDASLSQHSEDEGAPHMPAYGVFDAAPASNSSASFADLEMDDEMIEATPAETFGDAPEPLSTASLSSTDFTAAQASYRNSGPLASVAHAGLDADDWTDRAQASPGFVNMRTDVSEEVVSARPTFATQMASAAVADDALLDLGSVESPTASAASDADDFILDLEDDLPSSAFSSPTPRDVIELDGPEPDMHEQAGGPASFNAPVDTAGAFAEAAHGETSNYDSKDFELSPVVAEPEQAEDEAPETMAAVIEESPLHYEVQAAPHEEEEMTISSHGPIEPIVVPAEEPVPASFESSYTDGSVEGDNAKPPAAVYDEPFAAAQQSTHETASGAETSAPADPTSAAGGRAGLIGLEQLSPEAIDAIARRAVELLSERAVRDIAWEVVPELAERLITKRLEEDSRRH